VARSKVANWQTPWTAAEIPIRRNRIVEDGFEHLSGRPGESMRGRMRIHFINEFGEHEAGVDGGGLFKDFMEGIIKVAFDVQYGLFKVRVGQAFRDGRSGLQSVDCGRWSAR
jgi:hypothetical protein